MKRKIIAIFLVLLMLLPLVIATSADTNARDETKSGDRAALSATLDDEQITEGVDQSKFEPVPAPEGFCEPEEIEEPDGTEDPVDDIWDLIGAVEDTKLSGRKGAPAAGDYEQPELTAVDFANMADDVEETVLNWDGYVERSLVRDGSSLFWEGIDGAYAYIPDVRAQIYNDQLKAPASNPGAQCIMNGNEIPDHPTTSGNGWNLYCNESSDNIEFEEYDIAVFLPLYGLSSDFAGAVDYYGTIAGYITTSIMKNSDHISNYYIFTQKNVTTDRIAKALETCRVVFILTHGTTDRGKNTNTAATSYMYLVSDPGTTKESYHNGRYVKHGYHVGYSAELNSEVYVANGDAIADHMSDLSTNDLDNFLWLGFCYSMATDSFSDALCKYGTGVKVVCGYSDSVRISYEQQAKSKFWINMFQNPTTCTVQEAADTMWTYLLENNGDRGGASPRKEGADDYNPDEGRYYAYPVFVCHETGDSSNPNDDYPGIDKIHRKEYKPSSHSQWTLVDTSDPGGGTPTPGTSEPTPGPDGVYNIESLDPMHWSVAAPYVRTYYRGQVHNYPPDYTDSYSYNYDRDYVFLRYEWEVNNDGTPVNAYALFSTNYEVDDLYDKIVYEDGTFRYVVKHQAYATEDETHHFCRKIKMDLSFDEQKGKWKAVIPGEYPYSPTYSNGGWDSYVQYYDYTDAEYKKGWVFDHWEFTRGSDGITPKTAYVVYYNAWNTNDIKGVTAEIRTSSGTDYYGHEWCTWYAELEADDPGNKDGVLRRAIANDVASYNVGTSCSHFWIYDGVVSNGWDYSQFDSATGEGYATVTVQYHCAHGCGEKKTYTVKAYPTEKNENDDTFTAFIGPKFIKDSWNGTAQTWVGHWDYSLGGIDNITRYESTTKTYEPPATPTPSPTPTATPTATSTPECAGHNWRFDGFEWEYDYSYSGYDDPEWCYPSPDSPAYISFIKENTLSVKAVYHCTACGVKNDEQRGTLDDGIVYVTDEVRDSKHSFILPGMYRAEISSGQSLDHKDHYEDKVLGTGYKAWFFQGFEWDTTNGVKAYAVYHYGRGKTSSNSDSGPTQEEIEAWKEYDHWNVWDYYWHYYDVQYKIPIKPTKVKGTRIPRYTATIDEKNSPNGYGYSEDKIIYSMPTAIPRPTLNPLPTDRIKPPEKKEINPSMMPVATPSLRP